MILLSTLWMEPLNPVAVYLCLGTFGDLYGLILPHFVVQMFGLFWRKLAVWLVSWRCKNKPRWRASPCHWLKIKETPDWPQIIPCWKKAISRKSTHNQFENGCLKDSTWMLCIAYPFKYIYLNISFSQLYPSTIHLTTHLLRKLCKK